MSAVAATSGHTPASLKRLRASSGDESDSNEKRPRYFYILAPESESSYEQDSSEVESVYSVQGRETDVAKDTSDTSTDDPVEFEIASLSDEPLYPFSDNSSSAAEDIQVQLEKAHLMELSNYDSGASECSGASISCMVKQSVFPRRLIYFESCALCNVPNVSPFPYCFPCYKVKKNFFPPRPKRRKNPKKILQQQDSGIGFSENLSVDTLGEGSERLTEREESSQQEENSEKVLGEPMGESSKRLLDSRDAPAKDEKEMCGTCLVRPKNGAYVHSNIVHRYSCFECSKRIYKQTGRCPICNTHVLRVCRDIVI